MSPDKGYEKLPLEEQKKVLIEKIENAGWEAERLIKEIKNANDLYFDKVSQVKAEKWSNSRVAIVGDAAYCPTPITGKGTDLAMLGAYILAGELSKANYYKEAFKAYEDKMRPYVNFCQRLPPGVPRLVYPRSKLGVAILNGFISLLSSKTVKSIISMFSSTKKKNKENIVLPSY